MALIIYVRLNDEEGEMVKRVAGAKHQRWAKRVLLQVARQSLPSEAAPVSLKSKIDT